MLVYWQMFYVEIFIVKVLESAVDGILYAIVSLDTLWSLLFLRVRIKFIPVAVYIFFSTAGKNIFIKCASLSRLSTSEFI